MAIRTVRMIMRRPYSAKKCENRMKLGLLGGGTIARLVLEHLRRGEIPGVDVVAVAGRGAASRGAALAREFAVPYVVGIDALSALKPDVIMEAASHDAVREHLVS